MDVQKTMFIPFSFSHAEREIFKKKTLRTRDFAEQNIYIDKSKIKGDWKNKNNPALKGLFDLYDLPHVREMVLCKGTQAGGTIFAHICLAKEGGSSSDTALFVAADERSAKIQSKRIRQIFVKSHKLKELISKNPDDTTIYMMTLATGFIIKIGWGGSQISVASDSCRFVYIDEADKFDDPIVFEEAKARASTYHETSKILIMSVPHKENGLLMQEFKSCDAIYDYHVPCQICGTYQVMKFGNQINIGGFKWSEKHNFKQIKNHNSAYYECEHCAGKWDDYKRNEALQTGEWLPRITVSRPQNIGIHFPSWISPFMPLSTTASQYVRAREEFEKDNNDGRLIVWHSNQAAEIYKREQVDRKEELILALKDERPRGLVPKNAICLTASIDTQQKGFYYEIRAWAYGMELESWQIREGFVETFDGLHRILFEDEYKDIDGVPHIIDITLIDSGGGATDYGSSRTAEVYDFCRQFPGIYPIKGRQRMSQPYRVTQLDNYPGTNKPIPGGLKLYLVNTTYFKDSLARKLEIAASDPGAWHLHSEATEEYARQMCVEYKNNKGLWDCPRNKPNHFWDVAVYGLAAVEIIGLKFWKNPEETENKKQEPEPRQKIKQRRW